MLYQQHKLNSIENLETRNEGNFQTTKFEQLEICGWGKGQKW